MVRRKEREIKKRSCKVNPDKNALGGGVKRVCFAYTHSTEGIDSFFSSSNSYTLALCRQTDRLSKAR